MTTPRGFRLSAGIVFLGIVTPLPQLRAQVTESPRTIAPGKIRVEIDGIKLAYDRADAAGNKHTAVAVASTIVSAGLTSSVDLQVGVDLFLRETFEFRGSRDTRSGLGDVSFRTKWTFWRDEKLGAAMAVIPYVKLPTSRDGIGSDAAEGGIIVPWEMGVPGGVTAGAMFAWDMIRNHDDNGYDARWTVTAFAQRNFTRAFAVYGEAGVTAWSTGLSHWAGTVGVGALLHVTRSVQLDYELQRGLNSRATDWTHVFRVNWEW